MSKVVELFGHSVEKKRKDWARIVNTQQCPFLGKKTGKTKTSYAREAMSWEILFDSLL